MDKVIFFNCFKHVDYAEPDLYCPDFMKNLIGALRR